MDTEAEARQRVTPLLQPGETILGVGFGSNVVPMAARLVPIVTGQYVGHHILVGTDRRLFLLRTSIGFMGQPEGLGATHAVAFADLASVEPFSPAILMHTAVRLTRKDGLSHELMWPSEKRDVPGQATFVATFPGWLAERVRLGDAPRPLDDPRVPDLPPAPLAGHVYLMVMGTLAALFFAVAGLAFGWWPFGLSVALYAGGLAIAAGVERAQRRAHLAKPVAERIAAQAKRGPKKTGFLGWGWLKQWALAGIPAAFFVLVGGTIVQTLYHLVFSSSSSETAKASPRKKDTSPKPEPYRATVVGQRTSAKLPGLSTRVPASVVETYGDYALVRPNTGPTFWTRLEELDPPVDPPRRHAPPSRVGQHRWAAEATERRLLHRTRRTRRRRPRPRCLHDTNAASFGASNDAKGAGFEIGEGVNLGCRTDQQSFHRASYDDVDARRWTRGALVTAGAFGAAPRRRGATPQVRRSATAGGEIQHHAHVVVVPAADESERRCRVSGAWPREPQAPPHLHAGPDGRRLADEACDRDRAPDGSGGTCLERRALRLTTRLVLAGSIAIRRAARLHASRQVDAGVAEIEVRGAGELGRDGVERQAGNHRGRRG